jgi:glycogen debranching enzyme
MRRHRVWRLRPQSKRHQLADPVATCGDRVYCICSQNGLFPDSPDGHVPREMWGVWDHPIKLLDGFWFGASEGTDDPPQWFIEADACRAGPGYTEFDYRLGRLAITRRDVVPDGIEGMFITLRVSVDARSARSMQLHALFRSDLRPAWLGEQAGMVDGRDAAELRDGVCVFTDALNPWACAVGATTLPIGAVAGTDLWAANRTAGRGASVHLRYTMQPADDGVAWLTILVAGSAVASADALATLARLREEHATMIARKAELNRSIVETSQVITPDRALNDAMAWSKVINQMFVRDVPAIGRGVGAGLPEYPWWFGIDTEYAALPMLQSGQFELVRDTLRLLMRQSEAHNPAERGRVLHELSTTGVVFNAGNMVETPAFTRAVHDYWLWTGDRDFLAETYPFCRAGLLDYALGRNDADGDLCPSGRSIIETLEMHAGFEVIDVAAYTWEALARLADMARALPDRDGSGVGGEGDAYRCEQLAEVLGRRIREEWWLAEEGLFADVRASVDEVERTLGELDRQAGQGGWLPELREFVETARKLFQPYLARYAGQPRDVDLPWLLRHWVVMCPVEVGLATPEQAAQVLERLSTPEFCNEWGMFLHPQRHDVMSINTGLLALANARYGRVDQAHEFVRKLTHAFSFRTPGAVGEALPDRWCFLQLWSNVGLVSPVVERFLGIAPRAAERRLAIRPNLPSAWDWAEARQLRVGDARMDVRVERTGDVGRPYRVTVRGGEGWRVEST